MLSFSHSDGGLNSGPHAYIASTRAHRTISPALSLSFSDTRLHVAQAGLVLCNPNELLLLLPPPPKAKITGVLPVLVCSRVRLDSILGTENSSFPIAL